MRIVSGEGKKGPSIQEESITFPPLREAQDVISAVASGMADRTEERHATYGIYANGDELELCMNPLPVKDEQVRVWEQVKGNVEFEPTSEELRAYVEMHGYWHPYEVLPAMGLGLAAPYTPVLRRNNSFVPHDFHYAPDIDVGKSTTARMASTKMYGVEEISGGSIESKYRLAVHIDSIALPIVVDEADPLKEKRIASRQGQRGAVAIRRAGDQAVDHGKIQQPSCSPHDWQRFTN